jgi:hypothetical protein
MTKRSSLAAIGAPVVRKEDAELLTGQGRFSDDVNLPGQAYAVMVRSPHAHARIRGIDGAAAMAVPGVIAVLTGADAIKDGLKPIPHRPIIGPPDVALGKRDASDKFLSPHRVRRMPPNASRSISSRCRRSPSRSKPSRRTRRCFGTRRGRTSASMPRSATWPRPRAHSSARPIL